MAVMCKETQTSLNYNNVRQIILASSSLVRKRLLENVGIDVKVMPANLDENAIRENLISATKKLNADEVAKNLALKKADYIVKIEPESVIIAADQVLQFKGRIYDKPRNLDQARTNLLEFSGQMHTLHSAIVAVNHSNVVWSYVDVVRIWIRDLSPNFVDRYLAFVGSSALTSVGCYELEGYGAHLIEKIEGDYFTALGLPLLPLLDFMREYCLIES